jgi:hypothetical protein
MFFGVRLGGMWWLPFPSLRQVNGCWRFSLNEVRWGYGWPYPQRGAAQVDHANQPTANDRQVEQMLGGIRPLTDSKKETD